MKQLKNLILITTFIFSSFIFAADGGGGGGGGGSKNDGGAAGAAAEGPSPQEQEALLRVFHGWLRNPYLDPAKKLLAEALFGPKEVAPQAAAEESNQVRVLVEFPGSGVIALTSFEINPDETLANLRQRLDREIQAPASLGKISPRITEDFSDIPAAIREILTEKNITQLPLVVDKLFLGQGGPEITEDTISSIKKGDTLVFSSKTGFGDVLQGANLQGADLRRADLRRADLRGANLRGANLYGADLTEADLTEAKLEDADLEYADLTEAKLEDADLYHADLQRANLIGADLTGADLRRADLRGANLRGAIVSQKQLDRARGVTERQRDQVREPAAAAAAAAAAE